MKTKNFHYSALAAAFSYRFMPLDRKAITTAGTEGTETAQRFQISNLSFEIQKTLCATSVSSVSVVAITLAL
jgi:hypothetical protein